MRIFSGTNTKNYRYKSKYVSITNKIDTCLVIHGGTDDILQSYGVADAGRFRQIYKEALITKSIEAK